jgi:putative PIN family toxin of toxin-antitoxin system
MQKIIVDTNVIVSALISNSVPTKILYYLVLSNKVLTCLSKDIFSEYVDVLNRDKFKQFRNFKNSADIVLYHLRKISDFYTISTKVDLLSDKSDNKFLDLASVCMADFLVTGNTRVFKISHFENTTILTPREYWDQLEISK